MASIHNTLICRQCRNYLGQGSRVTERGSTTQVRTVADNDYATSSAVTDYDVDISDGSNPTQVDAIAIKYTGDLTEYEATPTGGSGSAVTRTVPDEVTDIRGQTVSLEVGGLKYDLFLLDSDAFTATSVRMNFTGSNIRIYEIMLLSLLQEIDATTSDFVAWQPEQADRTGRVDLNPGGRLSKENGSGREKRDVELTIRITPGKTMIESVDDFLYDLERNKRIVFVEAFSENPHLVYPAVIASLRIPVNYRSASYKPLGYNVPLLVREQ